MADNNFLVGKWVFLEKESESDGSKEPKIVQLFKDGSCLIPTTLLGVESDETHSTFYFYKSFENGTVKFDSGDGEMHLFPFKLDGGRLHITSLTGASFSLEKMGKRAPKAKAEPIKKAAKEEPVIEREPEEHEWKCPSCGKINQNYVGTCGCGEAKPKEAGVFNWAEVHPELAKKPEPEVEPETVEEVVEEAAAVEEEAIPVVELGENEWQCPNCGKVHQKYVGTCGCGEAKPASAGPYIPPQEVLDKLKPAPAPVEEAEEEAAPEPEKPAEPEVEPGENEWKCPKCGKIQQKYVGTCGCGEPKPASVGPYIPPQEVLDKIKKENEPKPVDVNEEETAAPAPEKPAEPEIEPGENEWKCPECGKIHQKYVGTCGCGASKPVTAGPYIPPSVAEKAKSAPVEETLEEIPVLEDEKAE